MRGISFQLLASQKGLCSMELVCNNKKVVLSCSCDCRGPVTVHTFPAGSGIVLMVYLVIIRNGNKHLHSGE
jgi:hypothetical protein